MQGRFIRIINAGKTRDFTAPCFSVHPFDIALLANFYRGVDKYFHEVVGTDKVADFVAGRTIWADGGADDHSPMTDDLGGDETDAANICIAVFLTKAESL